MCRTSKKWLTKMFNAEYYKQKTNKPRYRLLNADSASIYKTSYMTVSQWEFPRIICEPIRSRIYHLATYLQVPI